MRQDKHQIKHRFQWARIIRLCQCFLHILYASSSQLVGCDPKTFSCKKQGKINPGWGGEKT